VEIRFFIENIEDELYFYIFVISTFEMIDLSHDEIDECISELLNLCILLLKNNKINIIPEFIKKLNLKEFDISFNRDF
jgi:Leucine-rich repeat (LRR) protein